MQVVEHGLLERSNGSMASTADASFRYFCKQSLDQIQPTSTGRREVDMITRMAREPSLYLTHLVRAIVVHYQVNLETAGEIGVDIVEKPQEFLMPVPAIATAYGDPAGYIQGRKQRCHSMPLVIMRLARRYAWRERQNRLSTVQRLDLTLFVYTQHDRAIRWIHIQPNDVPYLLDELRVFGQFEAP